MGVGEINLGTTIACERRALGATQEQVAEHLGVTKAAVSKWELGQSLPDVALLPKLAAYFGVTLDALLDYRPQLSEEEVQRAGYELSDAFAQDAEAAFAQCVDLTARYWSCWSLLMTVGDLLFSQAALGWQGASAESTERACDAAGACDAARAARATEAVPAAVPSLPQRCAAKAQELFERVSDHAEDADTVRCACVMLATLLAMQGKLDEAKRLLEPLMPTQPLGAEVLLASIYQRQGDTRAARRVQQRALLSGLLTFTTSLVGVASTASGAGDVARMHEVARVAEALQRSLDFTSWHPNFMTLVRRENAAAYLAEGRADEAFAELARFIDAAAEEAATYKRYPGGVTPLLFDEIPDLLHTDDKASEALGAGERAAASMSKAFAEALRNDPRWAAYVEDGRFTAAVARLDALQ